ncbi:Protein OS-9 [Apophysomyces sp. BC1015]|nr:Protein OS-9 [Apophysomyces sp. BC1015]KAG0175753.1 Protein OS-9 [Apophysomyces sp. BC1021]
MQDENSVVMMSAQGQPFLCVIPQVDNEAEKAKHQHSHPVSEEDIQRSIERGLQLLEPLGKSCLYYHSHAYWTYEYCHMKHVRQFYIDQNTQGESASAQSRAPSFYLGMYLEPKKVEGKSEQTDVSQKLEKPTTSLRHVGDKRYLVQRWTGGTNCDLTDKPRSVEIQAHDRISQFHEVTICQYQIIISTPRLCEEMVLASQTKSDAHTIECDPIVPENLISNGMDDKVEHVRYQAEVSTYPVGKDATPSVTESDTETKNMLENTEDLKVHEKEISSAEVIKEDKENQEDVEPETKELLLTMIAQLTSQVNQLQRQAQKSELRDGAGQDDVDFIFSYTDEQRRILEGDSAQIQKPLTSQTKRAEEEKRKSEKNQMADGSEVQQRNKEAYRKTYFTAQ